MIIHFLDKDGIMVLLISLD